MKSHTKRTGLLVLLVVSSLLAGCAPRDSEETRPGMGEVGNTRPVDARRELTDSFDGSQDFGGYSCTDDCSGHEAGYQWAEENGIEDPDDCDGNSDSFIEGCITYAEEQFTDRMNVDEELNEDEYAYE